MNNFLGYLVTLANLHNFAGSPNDVSIRVATVGTIADELQRIPGFNLEGFRDTGYQRHGLIGIYLSKKVQEYIFHNAGKPTDEGLMMTLFFPTNPDKTQFGTGAGDVDRQTLFVRRQPKISDDVRKIINQYAKTGDWSSGQVTN